MRRARPGLVLVLALGAAACGSTDAASTTTTHAGRDVSSGAPTASIGTTTSTTTTTTPARITIPPASPGGARTTTTTRGGARGATTTTSTTTPTSTLLVQFGSGNEDTAQFTVTEPTWQLNWSYNCTSYGSVGNFITAINGYGQAVGTPDIGTDQLGWHGSGDNVYSDQGTFNVSIDSECTWSVSVIES